MAFNTVSLCDLGESERTTTITFFFYHSFSVCCGLKAILLLCKPLTLCGICCVIIVSDIKHIVVRLNWQMFSDDIMFLSKCVCCLAGLISMLPHLTNSYFDTHHVNQLDDLLLYEVAIMLKTECNWTSYVSGWATKAKSALDLSGRELA